MRFNSPGDALEQCRNPKRKKLGPGAGTPATALLKLINVSKKKSYNKSFALPMPSAIVSGNV